MTFLLWHLTSWSLLCVAVKLCWLIIVWAGARPKGVESSKPDPQALLSCICSGVPWFPVGVQLHNLAPLILLWLQYRYDTSTPQCHILSVCYNVLPISLKFSSFHEGIWTPDNTSFLRPTQPTTQKMAAWSPESLQTDRLTEQTRKSTRTNKLIT